MDWRRFSSQRMLSFCSIGTRVGLILRLSAAVPLNCCRDQNFTADEPQRQTLRRHQRGRRA